MFAGGCSSFPMPTRTRSPLHPSKLRTMTVTQWRVLNGNNRVLLVRCILWQNGWVFPTSLSPIVLTGRKLGIEDLKQTFNPSSLFPTSHKSCLLRLLQGGNPIIVPFRIFLTFRSQSRGGYGYGDRVLPQKPRRAEPQSVHGLRPKNGA